MYQEFTFSLNEPADELGEILASILASYDFESVQEGNILKAYSSSNEIGVSSVDWEELSNLQLYKAPFQERTIEKVNWNKKWESNFSPVTINGVCYIRADFHKSFNDGLLELVITPKMSFGTGHHQTTALMLKALSKFELGQKSVLDMGTGTGILAIYAALNNAQSITAIDNDDWCILNTKENLVANNCVEKVQVALGDGNYLAQLKDRFDLVIANINRNVLLQDMFIYNAKLNSKGHLFLSGFHKVDAEYIIEEALKNSLQLIEQLEDNNWMCLVFKKP